MCVNYLLCRVSRLSWGARCRILSYLGVILLTFIWLTYCHWISEYENLMSKFGSRIPGDSVMGIVAAHRLKESEDEAIARRFKMAETIMNRSKVSKGEAIAHPLKISDSIGNRSKALGQEIVAARLKVAESIWNRAKRLRQVAVNESDLQDNVDSLGRTVWDFFYPSFDCPFTKERIGRVGDGGKWICGFDQLENKSQCVVFSFGVSGDTSFEEEILRRTQNCIVHMFDHTILKVPAIVEKYPTRAFFHKQGINSQNGGIFGTLKSIMAALNIQVLDVLKMDIERSEWAVIDNIVEDFPERLPFAQLQLELHLTRYKRSDWLKILNSWSEMLESAGLRQFFQEPNLGTSEIFGYRELSFLNIKLDPFQL